MYSMILGSMQTKAPGSWTLDPGSSWVILDPDPVGLGWWGWGVQPPKGSSRGSAPYQLQVGVLGGPSSPGIQVGVPEGAGRIPGSSVWCGGRNLTQMRCGGSTLLYWPIPSYIVLYLVSSRILGFIQIKGCMITVCLRELLFSRRWSHCL